jgi:ABC-type lipoprotein export system ATPase subunit
MILFEDFFQFCQTWLEKVWPIVENRPHAHSLPRKCYERLRQRWAAGARIGWRHTGGGDGSIRGPVGRSGCGKSTLLNLAGGMDFPLTGEVKIDGISTAGLADAALTRIRREKVGFIFQSFQLLYTLSVFENIELPLLLAGRGDVRNTARERLAWVELEGLGDRLPHQLSGGQMQRVAIARAPVHSPKIIRADEPTGNLDSVTGNVILGGTRLSQKNRATEGWNGM